MESKIMEAGENELLISHVAYPAIRTAMNRWKSEYTTGQSEEAEQVAAVYADDEEYSLEEFELLNIDDDEDHSDSDNHLVKAIYIAKFVLHLVPNRSGEDGQRTDSQQKKIVERSYRIKHYMNDTWLIIPAY